MSGRGPIRSGLARWHISFCVRGLVFLAALGGSLPALEAAAQSQAQNQSPTPNQQPVAGPRPAVSIPKVERAPQLEDFLDMKPNGNVEGKLLKVEGFIQRDPKDGEPATQKTEVYLGYDDKNLYLVWVCFDTEPGKVRARLARRENAFDDDFVEVTLDTFKDQRRGFLFWSNPLGVQADALWSEGRGPDFSFDTLWHSQGQVTDRGYVVWMALPFRSLRFASNAQQSWGLVLARNIPRASEWTFWPRVSSRITGRLNQAATLNGLENISPGRNVQLIPYGIFSASRALDSRDPNRPFFREKTEADGGLDAKFVLRDSLVLDVTVNPDFAQVESDEPRVTTNQRFEVFFPEKRPFFLENAGFFREPLDLVFTRRVRDPQFGVRLTGKIGPWALGGFLIDDQAPGKSVLEGDPLENTRAYVGIARVSRDVGQQSSVGFIYTDREFEQSYNRIGAVGARFKLSPNWTAELDAGTSWTRFLDGTTLAGPSYELQIGHNGRRFNYEVEYIDRGRDFFTALGFVPRIDTRGISQFVGYRFRPEGKYLISWGPSMFQERLWDHSGTRLDWRQHQELSWSFVGDTYFGFFYGAGRERLRPEDFGLLPVNRDFSNHYKGLFFGSSFFKQVSFFGNYEKDVSINFVPPAGQEPFLADADSSFWGVTVRPITPLAIDHLYIFNRLRDPHTPRSLFNDHILRQKWNWQFSRELSLRVILQYNATLANGRQWACEHTRTELKALFGREGREFLETVPVGTTDLCTSKDFNADILVTYLVNPGTALYVGYNGNAGNFALLPDPTFQAPDRIVSRRTRDRFINDASGLFAKFSYLFRF